MGEIIMVTTVEPTCHTTVKDMVKIQEALVYTVHATDMDTDTHAVDLTTTVTAMDTSETMDTHQAPHVEMVCTCTMMTTVVIAMTIAEDMVTWTVTTTDMVIHVMEIITVTTVEPTCHTTVKDMVKIQAALVYTVHATDMDMDTHAEDLTTTVTAMDTSETMDTHQAPHVVMVCICIWTIIAVIAMTTVVDTVTWTVTTTDMVIHATEIIMVMIAEPTCHTTVKDMVKIQAALAYTAHATDMDTDTHAEDLTTTVTAM